MDAEQDARVASAVWPAVKDASKAGITPLGFAVLGGATSDIGSDTVTRASVDLDSLPRIPATRAVGAHDAGVDKAKRVTLDADGAAPQSVPADQVAQVVKASLAEPTETKDIRQISGSRVNMRMGPGTKFSVAAKLVRGTEVEVLQNPGNGWLKLRVQDTGRVGWMADYLVTAAN